MLAKGATYERLESLGARLDDALTEAARERPWLRWRRKGSLFWLHLTPEDLPRRSDRVSAEAVARFNAIHGPMLDRGYYLPPSGWEVMFLSAAHTAEHVDGLVNALTDALDSTTPKTPQ